MTRIYESILDDEDLILAQNATAADLIGDESYHQTLLPDEEFSYMMVIRFDLRDSSSYRFLKLEEPDHENNIFPMGAMCQRLNDVLDYNMFLSRYQISRIVVDDNSMRLEKGNKNRIDYEIAIADPLERPDYEFNIITECQAAGLQKFLGLHPVVSIYVPFDPPKQLPFMRMTDTLYQLCRQMNARIGGFWPDMPDTFELRFRTIHPTEWMDCPYTFSCLYTKYCRQAEQYKKIYKRIYGDDVDISQHHDIIRYKILRNTDLRRFAEQAAQSLRPDDGVTMTVTNIYQPPFDTDRLSTMDTRLRNKATKRTILRVVGFEVNAAGKKEVDINTLEDILANDFILKLPPDYCNSCLLTVCVRCNVRLTNNVNTDETMRSALREEIRERQGGWGKLIDWFANHNYRWVFNPCTKDQVKVENTDCFNSTNGKRTEKIWRIVDMQGKNTPEIRVFFCDKNGRVNRSPISDIHWYGEEYRTCMNDINELMETGVIWDPGYHFNYGGRLYGLW